MCQGFPGCTVWSHYRLSLFLHFFLQHNLYRSSLCYIDTYPAAPLFKIYKMKGFKCYNSPKTIFALVHTHVSSQSLPSESNIQGGWGCGSQREVQPLHKLQHIQQRWLPSKFSFTVIFFSFFFSWIFSKLEFNLISFPSLWAVWCWHNNIIFMSDHMIWRQQKFNPHSAY